MRYTFAPVRTRRTVKTFCPSCNKKLTRVLTRQCYDNGFHHVPTTMAKYAKELDKEQKRLEKKGTTCGKCAALQLAGVTNAK